MNDLIESSAHLSDDGVYRYALWRVWDKDKLILPWIMLNPSTADATADDPTIRRVMGFTRSWTPQELPGAPYGGIVVLNLYAYRATEPRVLAAPGTRDPVGPDNWRLFDWCMDAYRRTEFQMAVREDRDTRTLPVICAWGANARIVAGLEQDQTVLSWINAKGMEAWCLERTKEGHPKHPLYQPKSAVPRRLI